VLQLVQVLALEQVGLVAICYFAYLQEVVVEVAVSGFVEEVMAEEVQVGDFVELVVIVVQEILDVDSLVAVDLNLQGVALL
jgi:hypothetical protein